MDEKIGVAKNIIREELEKAGYKVLKIILFGSRAKGNYREDSDYDFYVIVDEEIDFDKKRRINSILRIRLAELRIPNDIIIQSDAVVRARRDDVGYLTYYVLKEGIEI